MQLRLDWMTAVTLLVLATLGALFVIGCGAGNVPGRSAGTAGGVTALPVTDASRELGLVVEFDTIRETLTNETLSEEGRLVTVLGAYRSSLQQGAIVLEQRFPREPPLDAVIRQATTVPLGPGETYAQRAAQLDGAFQRLFYLYIRAALADVTAKLTDPVPANDTDLTDGVPHDWDRAWAYYQALDETARERTSANPIEFPQFAGTLHEVILRAFLDGQNAILFGAGAPSGGGTSPPPRPYAGGNSVRALQYGGGTPGGVRPGEIRPTGPDVAAALRNERLIQRKLTQVFYLSVLRDVTDLVLRLEANQVDAANAARRRGLEYYRALFTQVEQGAGSAAANNLQNLLSASVNSPADFTRERRTALVEELNRALAGVLLPEERVSPVQLLRAMWRGVR